MHHKPLFLFPVLLLPLVAWAHGFNANTVSIRRLPNGLYRVSVAYTDMQAGQYRQAHGEFADRKSALQTYDDLRKGADFFSGDLSKTVHFHNPPQTPTPY